LPSFLPVRRSPQLPPLFPYTTLFRSMRFVEHLNSCARQCIAIADVLKQSFRCRIPIQRDYLIAGALLADVGKPLEYDKDASGKRSEEHTSELQSRFDLVCRLLLEKKN